MNQRKYKSNIELPNLPDGVKYKNDYVYRFFDFVS